MPNQNVVNPGTVNVADQGDGLLSVDQPVTVSPPSNAGPVVQAGAFSPVSPDTENIITNDVVQQVYGVGTPKNVFV